MHEFRKNKRWAAVAALAAAALPAMVLVGCGTAVEPSGSGKSPAMPATPAMMPDLAPVAAPAMGPAMAMAMHQPNAESKRTAGPHYNADGELLLPVDHHEWVFVGAPVTPNDMNDGRAAFPEFHNVYIDPASFASYKHTGEFPQGTMILKELVAVGGKQMPSGNGYFQGEFNGLEAMVKDQERFADEPGGWAFFRFGEAPHYNPVGARMETASCNACHAGGTQDYVFTATYPVLRAARAKALAEGK